MIQKKICMIGTSGVGKTSLVSKYVHSQFSETYQTNIEVKVDKKVVKIDGNEVTLVIWDLEGDDEFQRLKMSYVRGSAGYLLVADGTRAVTLDQVVEIQQRVAEAAGEVPFLLALNKADLTEKWEIGESSIAKLSTAGWTILKTSAKEGAGVEEAFADLARRMLASPA